MTTSRVMIAVLLSLVLAAGLSAQQASRSKASAAPKRPDLSGSWSVRLGLPVSSGLKRQDAGVTKTTSIDRLKVNGAVGKGRGALPWTAEPAYKPEFTARVAELEANQSKTDPVFYCGRPGVPRVGPPRKIVQLADELIFLYEDLSGDTYRVIPTDGRAHRSDANPTYYGDSVGKWEGQVLVIDVRNFVEDTWLGEKGYFHTDALRVVERLWLDGDNLVWQASVHDPNVLIAPWTQAPRMIARTTQALEESPPCQEQDGDRLLNRDHHIQR
jgi:hypothetical protein